MIIFFGFCECVCVCVSTRTINVIWYKLRWANIYISDNYFSFNSSSIFKDTVPKFRFSQQRSPGMAALIPDNIDRIF